jgi:F-type H+-transporting ATPase subunit alpha
MADVAKNGTWNDDVEATFKSAIEQFKATQTW